MIPVVMLAINTGVLFSLITFFSLTVTRPLFEHILAIYLIVVVTGAIDIFFPAGWAIQVYITVNTILSITQVAQPVLSLLINIFATSIIALKAWCVCVHSVFAKHCVDVDCALIDNPTCAYIQETPQVAEGQWDRYPNS
jgi:hypothetical protein